MVLINPLYPPVLGDVWRWGTPADPQQREVSLDSLRLPRFARNDKSEQDG